MDYSVLSRDMRNELLTQRLAQHEQMYYEIQVQYAEVEALGEILDKERAEKAAGQLQSFRLQMQEIEIRADIIRKLMAAL